MPNKAKNEVVDSLVQAGVIQSIEAPKTEYVVSIPEAQQIDTIVEKFIEADELLFEGDSLMQTTAKALGKLAKTDRVDCRILALFAEKVEPVSVASAATENPPAAD